MHPYAKFGALIAVIVGTLTWLAVGGVEETKAYYKTIEEVSKMSPAEQSKRLRVAGEVEKIEKAGQVVKFTICQRENGKNLAMNVIYTGKDPLPDTFRVGAQALADGKMGAEGTLQATQIQAKCASKYEAKQETAKPGTAVNKPKS